MRLKARECGLHCRGGLLKHKPGNAGRLSSCVFGPNFSQMDFKVSDKSMSRLRVLLSLN